MNAISTQASEGSTLFREVACHSTLIIAGWSDASSGPLIPYIQRFYGISYTVGKSFHMSFYLLKGKVIVLGAATQLFGYTFLIPAFPFPVMPCAYAIIGFGVALQDAGANVFVATLPNAEYKFGLLHASYGLGALVCPLAATAFVSAGIKFSYFYSISICLATVNLGMVLGAFKFNYRVDDAVAANPIELASATSEGGVEAEVNNGTEEKAKGLLTQTFSNSTMWIFSLFIFLYVGAEVSMGGWIVSFLIDERGGGPSAGYVATGFWAGLTIGRIVLLRLNAWVGERRIVPYYLVIAAALELAVWFSKNLVGNAVTVALIVMSLSTKLLPRHLHASSIGFIAAIGQTGSAVFPFTTGALAQRFSTYALQPVMISLCCGMTGVWLFVPAVRRRTE
ncbi:hypothetical protein RQP46_002122 [Phenoliferia psychrophenolica]